MDRIDELIEAFRTEPASRVLRKLDVLLDLEQLRDARALPFLLLVAQDQSEALEVRRRIVRLLRSTRRCSPDVREQVAHTLCAILADRASTELRVAAGLTLAEFVGVDGVPSALGAIALDSAEPLDLRYCAFTSLERAENTPETDALLRRIALDDALGPSARNVLARWQQS
jgi:hypothetical protein